jgi:hypothetical protein
LYHIVVEGPLGITPLNAVSNASIVLGQVVSKLGELACVEYSITEAIRKCTLKLKRNTLLAIPVSV